MTRAEDVLQACPPSTWHRFRKFARRNKASLAAASLVALALVSGTLVSTWQAIRATRAEEQALAQAAKAQTVSRLLQEMLASAHPEHHKRADAIFGSARAGSERPGAAMGEGFHDFVEFDVEAEALGYCASFLVEHHFTGWNQVSATLQLLTWLAARTTTLRLGTAVLVLPWHNPVLLAEQAATLDLLSGGRLDFGIGKGYRHTEFEGFCIPPEEARARFDEAIDVILTAWTRRERFSHKGRVWRFKLAHVTSLVAGVSKRAAA